MKQSLILTIYGKVQGVGFRYFVKQKANSLNICGFVKNMTNGTVYIEAEGLSESLLLFIRYCERGPAHAHVEKTDIQYCPAQGFIGFIYK